MNIYALYVRKGDDLEKLFDSLLCLLRGLERLAESLVGMGEEWFPFLDNIQNDIGINQYSYCLDSRSSRMLFSSIA